MTETTIIALCILAFLIGALPSGFIIGRIYGVDLREEGSGNIGATNARRVLGKKAGVITLIFDTGKGVFATCLDFIFPMFSGFHSPLAALYGVFAVAGHCYSPFLKFKGGKGVATSLGVFLTLAPIAVLVSFTVFVVGYLLSGFASVGSMSAAVALPVAMYFSFWGNYESSTVVAGCIAGFLVLLNHRENISRLLRKQELDAKRSARTQKGD